MTKLTNPPTELDTNIVTDDKVKIVDRKIDLKKAVRMRFVQGCTVTDIAKVFNCTKQAVSAALMPFNAIMKDQQIVETFNANQTRILEGTLAEFVANMMDQDKLKKASLNNVAYSFDRVFNALRLLRGESTSNVLTATQHHESLEAVEAEIAAIEGGAGSGLDEESDIDREIKELEEKVKVDGEG